MTGRGAGNCGENTNMGLGGASRGQGFRGRGGGRGQRNCFQATGQTGWQRLWSGMGRFNMGFGAAQGSRAGVEPGDELQALKDQAGFLEDSLNKVRGRLEELEAPPKKK